MELQQYIYIGVTSVKERSPETGNPKGDDDFPNDTQTKVFLVSGNEGKDTYWT